ncbi:hypothetical protein [Sarcina ventriculi]
MCNCEAKYIKNRYVNRGCDEDGYIRIFDKLKEEEFCIEQIEPNSFSNNGYDEVYYCTKCGKSGYGYKLL